MKDNKYNYLNHFSTVDKWIARITFPGLFILGEIAILQFHLFWGLIYIAAFFTGFTLMATKWFCPFCPYPSTYNDCLIFPALIAVRSAKYLCARCRFIRCPLNRAIGESSLS